MNAERQIAMDLLDAVWKEDVQGVKYCLQMGASPSWVFNGYPILCMPSALETKKLLIF